MSNGVKSTVGITNTGHEAFLNERWESFVYTHSIEVCDTLVFTHRGGSNFKILQYKANGCMHDLDVIHPEARMPLGNRRYHPWDIESEDTSDLDHGLNLPTIWWKTHVEDTDSVYSVTFWVGDDTWTMYVKIEAENVWICRGWKTFASATELRVGTTCKFKMLLWPTTTFSVTFS
ncbi:putative B3 domain-containing protein isoform X2 [Salvia divinorum]|uniref:B3 domain-containing protein isoform X2 n=1 Tax=Salvia divinorum TaxID=28513 RepID=A0ABD1IJK4_SALDI